jgi:hypothetical protein
MNSKMYRMVVGAAVALASVAATAPSAGAEEIQFGYYDMKSASHRMATPDVAKPRERATRAVYAPTARIAQRINGRIVVNQVSFLGSSPYICSPSGFGRTSSCRDRT